MYPVKRKTINTQEALTFGLEQHNCHDCGAKPGEFHIVGCDVEQCSVCHGQRIACSCSDDSTREVYSGFWPGTKVAAKLGWYTVFGSNGWRVSSKDSDGASTDINRVALLRASGFDGVTGKTAAELSGEFGIDIYEN